MKKAYITLLVLALSLPTFAQTQVKFCIHHKLEQKELIKEVSGNNNIGHVFNVKRLEYYLSGIKVIHDGGQMTAVPNPYILVDGFTADTFDLGSVQFTKIEGIQFSVGVDTPNNNADPNKWPQAHPLAPKLPSMHWGWAAGYRFVAMEGKADVMLDKSYELHALGNQNYFLINIPLNSSSDGSAELIELKANYAKALEDIALRSGVISHGATGPCETILRNFNDHVFTSMDGSSNTLQTERIKTDQNRVQVYPNPAQTDGSLHIDLGTAHAAEMFVYDLTGRLQTSIVLNKSIQELNLDLPQGMYLVRFVTPEGIKQTERILIQ